MISEIDTRPFPTAPPAFNLAGHVLARADRLHKSALTILHAEADETLTYADLLRLTQGCATALLALGLRPGDRILLRLGNTLAFPVLYLGAIWAGLVPVPTSAALTAAEITRLAALVQPSLVAAEPAIPLPDHPAPLLGPDLDRWSSLPPGTTILALFYEAPCEIAVPTLQECAEKTLARWKQPRHYQRLDAMPRTGTGKLIRKALAAYYRRPE